MARHRDVIEATSSIMKKSSNALLGLCLRLVSTCSFGEDAFVGMI